MTASGQRVFLNLIEDSSEPFEVAKSILKSPLELSRTIICHLFSNDLSGLYEQVDEIKGFAAGVTRAMDERAHYRLADYYMMLFPFQQWFHSSYRARQGKALEALLDQFFRGYTSFPDLITDKKRRKEFLVTECGLTELSEVGDIDVMATTRDKSMVIILQMRSRDDTGGTTAKGSLVDALKQLMRVKEAPRKQVLYLIGIWDPRGYEQHDSTVKKILSSIQELLKIGDFTPEEAVLSGFTGLAAQWCAAKDEEQKRQLLSEISKELEKGVQLKQNLILRLAYGKDNIIDAICGWGSEQSSVRLNSSTAQTQEVQRSSDIDVASARRSIESPVSEHSQAQEARNALKKVMDWVTQWDDLWLAYAAASMEIDVIKTRDLSNTSILVDLLQKLGADSQLELDSIESVQRWVDLFAERVHSQWDQDSIPFRTPRDQYLYIRDMMYLYAIYRKYCKSSKDLPRSRDQVHHTETETVVKEPPGYYQPSLLDVEPPDSNSEVTLVSFRELTPEITDTTYLTHGLFYYPAKFIPQVPNYCIRQYTKSGDWVMDPFAGSGTVGLEAALLGRNSILLDINPLLEHIVPIKILFKHDNLNADALMQRIKAMSESQLRFVPQWSNLDYWYDPEVLDTLCRYWGWLKANSDDPYSQVIKTALLKISKQFSYAEHRTPKLFRSRYKETYMKEMLANDWRSSMYNFLMQEASDTLYRLTDLAKLRLNVEVVYYGGVDTASCVPVNDMRVAAVITSPPYLQAQEYIRTSKLELFWLGYSEDEVKRISRLEIPYRKAPCAVSTHYLAALRSRLTSHKLRELLDSYFYYTLRALENASAFLVPGGRLCVFVGNPKVDGIEVETWKVISEYFEPKGFVRERVYEDRIKNRQLFRGRRNKNPEGIKSEYLVVLRRI